MSLIIEQSNDRRFTVGLAILALGLIFLYIKTLSPAFPPNDSPESITAAFGLGIQHPPGYPLHSLLGRLSILLWPVGSPAWRVNTLSVFLGVSACLGLAALVRTLVQAAFPGASFYVVLAGSLSGAVFLGASRTFWAQATEAKGGIYLLNLLLLAGLMRQVLKLSGADGLDSNACRNRQGFLFFCLLAGLSLANHYPSALLCLAAMIPCLVLSRGRAWMKEADFAGAGLFFLAGLSLYIYLPLRAAFHPVADLGAPETWNQFLWVVLRRGYTQAAIPNTLNHRLLQTLTLAKFTLKDATVLMPAAAVLGGAALWFRLRRALLLPALVWGLVATAVTLVNRTEPGVQWLNEIFLLPAQAQLCLLAGVGVAGLALSLPWFKAGFRPLALPLPLAAAMLMGALFYGVNDRANEFSAYDFGRGLALSLKPHSLYLAEGDFHVMPLFYLQGVEGRRQDLSVVVNVLLHHPFARKELSRQRPDLAVPDLNDDREAVKGLVRLNLGRVPLAFSPYHPTVDGLDLEGTGLKPFGLVEECRPKGEEAGQNLPMPGLPERWLNQKTWSQREPLVQTLLPWYGVCLVNTGNTLLDRRPDLAAACYKRALSGRGEMPQAKILFNLGRAYVMQNRLADAESALQKSLEKDPALSASQSLLREVQDKLKSPGQPGNGDWVNKLKQADKLGQVSGQQKEALKLYRAVIRQGHFSAPVWRNVGVLHAQLNQWAEAGPAFEEAEKLDPKNPELVKMRVLSLEKLGKREESIAVLKAGAERTGDAELKRIVEQVR